VRLSPAIIALSQGKTVLVAAAPLVRVLLASHDAHSQYIVLAIP